MQLKLNKPSLRSRKTQEQAEWEQTIDALAMHICPVEVWQDYEKQMQTLTWKAKKDKKASRISVFPIWRQYRQQALRVATLHRTLPMLRRLPIGVACFLGDLLFK